MPNHNCILSIDIGGSKIIAGAVDADGNILFRNIMALWRPITKNELFTCIVNMCNDVIHRHHVYTMNRLSCVAAAIPGLCDPTNGMWVYSSFSGIHDFPIAKMLSGKLNLPVYLENDVNACAMGEMMFGACKDVDDFFWVTVSNGIGGCVVLNGGVYAGANMGAGEIGHVCVDENGPMCECGNRGCAEACAAGPAILRRYLASLGDVSPDNNAGLNAKIIADRARQGEETAIQVYEKTGYYLGKAIASTANILNPKKIIIGGGVSESMDLFYPALMETLNRMLFRAANPNLTVEKTALGNDAGLLGAAAVGLRHHI